MAVEDLRIRRYERADIPGIIEFAKTDDTETISEKRLTFVLNNNITNQLMYAGIVTELGDIVGVLLATLVYPIINEELHASPQLFVVSPDHGEAEAMLKDDYRDWCVRRNAIYEEPTP